MRVASCLLAAAGASTPVDSPAPQPSAAYLPNTVPLGGFRASSSGPPTDGAAFYTAETFVGTSRFTPILHSGAGSVFLPINNSANQATCPGAMFVPEALLTSPVNTVPQPQFATTARFNFGAEAVPAGYITAQKERVCVNGSKFCGAGVNVNTIEQIVGITENVSGLKDVSMGNYGGLPVTLTLFAFNLTDSEAQHFGAAAALPISCYGVLGTAFPAMGISGFQKEQNWINKLLNSADVESPQFSVALFEGGDSPAGTAATPFGYMTLGERDPAFGTGVVASTLVLAGYNNAAGIHIPPTSPNYQFYMAGFEGIALGSGLQASVPAYAKYLQLPCSFAPVLTAVNCFTAKIDTGTPAIILPSTAFDTAMRYSSSISTADKLSLASMKALITENFGKVLPCATLDNSLPGLTVYLNGTTFTLTPFDYSHHVGGDNCQSALTISPNTFFPVFGAPFLKNFYTTFSQKGVDDNGLNPPPKNEATVSLQWGAHKGHPAMVTSAPPPALACPGSPFTFHSGDSAQCCTQLQSFTQPFQPRAWSTATGADAGGSYNMILKSFPQSVQDVYLGCGGANSQTAVLALQMALDLLQCAEGGAGGWTSATACEITYPYELYTLFDATDAPGWLACTSNLTGFVLTWNETSVDSGGTLVEQALNINNFAAALPTSCMTSATEYTDATKAIIIENYVFALNILRANVLKGAASTLKYADASGKVLRTLVAIDGAALGPESGPLLCNGAIGDAGGPDSADSGVKSVTSGEKVLIVIGASVVGVAVLGALDAVYGGSMLKNMLLNRRQTKMGRTESIANIELSRTAKLDQSMPDHL